MPTKNRLFISFAVEDKYARDFLAGQARLKGSPFEFIDMSLKEPFDSSWKTQCRSRIKSCDGVIALLSKNTQRAIGARWEIWCARDEGIKILGIHINKDNKGPIPPELAGVQVIEWSWNGITRFIQSL